MWVGGSTLNVTRKPSTLKGSRQLSLTTHWLKLVKRWPQWGQEVQSQHDSGDRGGNIERITLTTSTAFNSSASDFCQTTSWICNHQWQISETFLLYTSLTFCSTLNCWIAYLLLNFLPLVLPLVFIKGTFQLNILVTKKEVKIYFYEFKVEIFP